MKAEPHLLLVSSLAAAVAVCGCGAGGGKGQARVWISRNRGAIALERRTVPAGLTALQGLYRVAKVETGYGGGFVTAVNGLSGSGLHQCDWFYFVNGYESDRGAASYRLRAGDVEWWDYRCWRGVERAPVVVGAFPEPFLHGFDGKTRAAAVRFGPGLRAEALELARLIHAGAPAPRTVPVAATANLLLVVSGRRGIVAGLRSGDRAGDPVRFVVSGKGFAHELARRPQLVRFRYEVVP